MPYIREGLPYTTSLTRAISFHRLCDGLQTLALIDGKGQLADLIDIQEWAKAQEGLDLPVPPTSRYEPHCRATLEGGCVCLLLSPAGEIKVFANGAQVFNFLGGKWHLTDAVRKYALWTQAVGDLDLARRLFIAALNMAEDRRGGLFLDMMIRQRQEIFFVERICEPPSVRPETGKDHHRIGIFIISSAENAFETYRQQC